MDKKKKKIASYRVIQYVRLKTVHFTLYSIPTLLCFGLNEK